MVSWRTESPKQTQQFRHPALVSVRKFALLPTRAEDGRTYWLEYMYHQYESDGGMTECMDTFGGPWHREDHVLWNEVKIFAPTKSTPRTKVVIHGSPGQDNQPVPNTEGTSV